MANQGSIYHWARDHRVHHRYSETSADPHDATRGFFFSHMGWLFVDKHPKVIEAGKTIPLKDLEEEDIVMFQERNKSWMMPLFCFVVPAALGVATGVTSYWRGLFIYGALRYIVIMHATWMVNSVAHMWGSRPYDPTINPAENWFVAFWAMGEGYHNMHHVYPRDYTTSEYGWYGQWNPTALFIDIMALCGLVTDRYKKVLTAKDKKGVPSYERADAGEVDLIHVGHKKE